MLRQSTGKAVSYTHLDVYKRPVYRRAYYQSIRAAHQFDYAGGIILVHAGLAPAACAAAGTSMQQKPAYRLYAGLYAGTVDWFKCGLQRLSGVAVGLSLIHI